MDNNANNPLELNDVARDKDGREYRLPGGTVLSSREMKEFARIFEDTNNLSPTTGWR